MGRPKKIKVDPNPAEHASNSVETIPVQPAGTLGLRDCRGLLIGVEYKFKPTGFVDWRAMINPEHIRLNRENFLKKDPPVEIGDLSDEEVEALKKRAGDKDLIITLAGFKELAQLRGYHNLRTQVKEVFGRITATCEIDWIKNFETEMCLCSTTGNADATTENVHSISKDYLVAVAENRAICRAVRTFLQIHPVAQDELKMEISEELSHPSEGMGSGPQSALRKKLKDVKVNFAEMQQKLLEVGGFTGAETWSDFRDIPADQATLLLSQYKTIFKC
jgi:hypothetical protein